MSVIDNFRSVCYTVFNEIKYTAQKGVYMNRITKLFGINTESCEALNIGHINRTYLITSDKNERYILQSLSRSVFTSPEAVMENIAVVSEAFRNNTAIKVPHFLSCGDRIFADVNGEIWRMYEYIPSAECESPFFKTAFSFGSFIRTMCGYSVSDKPPIPNFHSYSTYLSRLLSFEYNHKGIDTLSNLGTTLSAVFTDKLPKRIIHGDAKTDNIIMGNPCTIIDLDTVMYGYAAVDYGDMVRSVCRNSFDISAVSEITIGFAQGLDNMLTYLEINSLYYGILWVTGELAVRYLTDAVSGERYFADKSPSECFERTDGLLENLRIFTENKEAIQGIIEASFS